MSPSRIFAAIAQVSLALAISTAAHAQGDYPDKVVNLVVPAAAGSVTDVIARIVGDQLSQRWKQPVIVSNISGGGLNIGAERVAVSAPDGYTLLVAPPTPLTLADFIYRDLPYDPQKFVPISVLVRVPNVLLARNDLAANSLPELIAYAKAHPSGLNYGSQGAGTTSHLSFKLLEKIAGVQMVHVPYRGEVPILNDIVAGHVDLFFGTMSTALPLIRAKKMKVLAVGGLQRSPFLPEIPTVIEQGLPAFQSVTWFAMAAPPNTPAGIVDKINGEVAQILQDQALREKLKNLVLEPVGGSRAETATFFAAERSRWHRVIVDAEIKPQTR